MALTRRKGRFMSHSLRKMAFELVFLLPVVLLVACSGAPGPTPKSANTPGKVTAPAEVGSLGRNVGTMALDTARSMLGVAYRYGGADPRGFDCSGLVQYSFAQGRVKSCRALRRISSEPANWSTRVICRRATWSSSPSRRKRSPTSASMPATNVSSTPPPPAKASAMPA